MKTAATLSASILFINPTISEPHCYHRYEYDPATSVATLHGSDYERWRNWYCGRPNTDKRCKPDAPMNLILGSPTDMTWFSPTLNNAYLESCSTVMRSASSLPRTCYYIMGSGFHDDGPLYYEGETISCEDICKSRTMVTWQGQTANYIDCALNERMTFHAATRWLCICAWDRNNKRIYKEVVKQRRDRILQSRTPSPTSTPTSAPIAFSFSQTGISSSRSFAELSADDIAGKTGVIANIHQNPSSSPSIINSIIRSIINELYEDDDFVSNRQKQKAVTKKWKLLIKEFGSKRPQKSQIWSLLDALYLSEYLQ